MHTVDEQEKQGYRFHNKNFINFQVLVFYGSLHYIIFPFWDVGLSAGDIGKFYGGIERT